jgi:DNA-binding XRE family transcriptional regulator
MIVISITNHYYEFYMEAYLPIPVTRALRKLGQDISMARRRRNIAVKMMAERAGISPTTLNKIEKGLPGVAMGNYASVIFVLGMEKRLEDLIDVGVDSVGLDLEEDMLPKRIRRKKRKED